MPDKKLTDKEIVKALECCVNGECPNCPLSHNNTGVYNERCGENLMQNALDLINRLQAENERLTIRLRKAEHQLDDAMKMYNIIKAEAYKEFAKELKHKAINIGVNDSIVSTYAIDNLLKELVGGK